MRVRYFSPEERVGILAEFKRGGLKAAYAVVPGRSTVGVRQFLTRAGVYTPTPTPGWFRDTEAMLVTMWQAGTSARAIGAALGRSPDAVQRHVHDNLERLGLKPRARRPPMTLAQQRIIGASVEALIDSLCERLGRKRGAIKNKIVHYCILQAKRARTANIVDLGGMAAVTTPGPQRKREAA